jgi:hypothetical protein
MALWAFKDYADESGRSVIAGWIDGMAQDRREKVRAKLDAYISTLKDREFAQWPPDWTAQIKGHPGLYEVRFTVKRVEYRPLFFFGPARREITLLIGAIEKNNRLIPPDAFGTASQRLINVKDDPKRAIDHE